MDNMKRKRGDLQHTIDTSNIGITKDLMGELVIYFLMKYLLEIESRLPLFQDRTQCLLVYFMLLSDGGIAENKKYTTLALSQEHIKDFPPEYTENVWKERDVLYEKERTWARNLGRAHLDKMKKIHELE